MEVGPFRMVSAAKSASGQVEVELVEGGWEEFATVVFSQSGLLFPSRPCAGFRAGLDLLTPSQSTSRQVQDTHSRPRMDTCMI